jgi:hypothetical protein
MTFRYAVLIATTLIILVFIISASHVLQKEGPGESCLTACGFGTTVRVCEINEGKVTRIECKQ